MTYLWKVDAGSTVKLKDYDPDDTDKVTDRASAEMELQKLSDELSDLQEMLSAAQLHSMLVVLPTQEELAHDFLWRVHKVTPVKGKLGIFNRSHYEDVLVVRVHNLVPQETWKRRYKEINHFEDVLINNGTIMLKFYLHISYEEQERRLLAREQDIDKAWKIDANDWIERRYWRDYQEAYEAALSECSTDNSPWYIVPANHKWYRNLAVAHTMVQTMRKYKDEWRAALEERGRRELELLKKIPHP